MLHQSTVLSYKFFNVELRFLPYELLDCTVLGESICWNVVTGKLPHSWSLMYFHPLNLVEYIPIPEEFQLITMSHIY